MKSHDWIFLMFTTIICCTTIITIAQAQQRGRVRFGMSIEKDDADKNDNPETVNLASQVRDSSPPRGASSRFRTANPSAIPSTVEETKESSRAAAPKRGSRGRANDRSSRKLTAEATEVIPLVRSRKRISPAAPAINSDQPIKIELPTSSIDRTNVIRRSKTRAEPPPPLPSSTATLSTGSVRRRSDVPSDVSTESIRKVRTFTSRSVTKQVDEVISSEKPLTVATTGSSNWRNVAIKRGSGKGKSNERKPKALEEDQLEDENYPEHFKLLLKKQQPSPALLPKNYHRLPVQEDQTYSKLNEVYEAPKHQARLRRLEQLSQETSDEILQVSRAIPKVRPVELKREDTARVALKSRRIEPRSEENIDKELKIDDPTKSRRTDAEQLRAQVKINKTAIKSRKKEPSNEVQQQEIPKVPYKPNRRTESSTEDNEPEVKPNEIEEPTKSTKTLFSPRRAEPYRPKPKTTTPRSTTTSKPIKKPEVHESRAKFKNRLNSRLQFPSLRTKTSSTSEEVLKLDNEVVHTSPAPQPPVRPLQKITKSRNLALDRPVVDARPKPKHQKFSSRYRGDAFSRYQQKTEPSKPIYTPTIPALTTEPVTRQLEPVKPYNLENHELSNSGSDFEGIVFDGSAGVWNMVEPIAGGLTRSEIIIDSEDQQQQLLPQSSVTVSIFEALADILSKTPTTTTATTTTTTTTTSTTELPDIIQVPEQKIDSISSTTVNTHDPITDVMIDDDIPTTTNEIIITNNDRDGRLLNSVEINSSTAIPKTSLSIDPSDSSETITVPQYTPSSDTTLLLRSKTEQTDPELTDFTTLPASPTQPTFTNLLNLTNISTRLLELTTLASNPPTSLPMPFLADALTTPGSSLVTQPQLISAINKFLDTSVQNASETMATTTENTTIQTTTTATLDTNSNPTDASTTLSPPITTTFSPPSTGSPPVTISFLDLFTIQAKKVNQNTEPAVEVHPIYMAPESTTIPVGVMEKKQTTGRPVNINTFFGTQTYPSISVSGSTSTDRTIELSSPFSSAPEVTGGVTTDTAIPSTSTLEQDTSTLDYTTSPQSSIRTQSLPIHLNSILGSTQKYDQTSPFKTVQTEITTTIRSRFGNRRIPILPAGSVQSTTNKLSTSTQTSSTTTTPVSTPPKTTTVTPVSSVNNQQQQQLSNVTITTTPPTEQNPIQDFSIYGILPNNTVVRKRPPQVSRQLDIGIMVYGILPNQTVVRKYPNGTLMIVDSSKDVEVIDIDPKMLFNPFSELYRTSQSSLLLTTHRSTTSHRLIESNHILSSSPSSSTEVVPSNNSATAAGSGGRRGNSIKETTENGNTESTLTTNTDDENLIQWLSENEDNIFNSTILVESNTENAVLLDLLKRKYIKTDLPTRSSSNVVSLTTARNIVDENSIPANKPEDVSENTLLFDSSEEKKKDSAEDFFQSKSPSVITNRFNNNNDDENVISQQFDTSYANVGIGSIFAGNKGRQFDNSSQRTKLYPINYEMAIDNTSTKLLPIHTLTSHTGIIINNNNNHSIQEEFLDGEVVNRTHSGVAVENPIELFERFETATPKRTWESKFIDFGILESEVDSETNSDYFMDPEDRLKIIDYGLDFDIGEGSGNTKFDDNDYGGFKGSGNTGDYQNVKSDLNEPKTDNVNIETSTILNSEMVSSTPDNVSLGEENSDSEYLKFDTETTTVVRDSENAITESPFIHIVFPEGTLESSEKFSDIYTTVSPLKNISALFESEYLIPSFNKNEESETVDKTKLLHDMTTFRSILTDKVDVVTELINIPLDIKNSSTHIENSNNSSNDKEFDNFLATYFTNVTSSSERIEEGLGFKNDSNSLRNGSQNETKSEGFFDSDSKISDDLDSPLDDNSSTENSFNNFASVDSSDAKDFPMKQHAAESVNSDTSSLSEISSSEVFNSSSVVRISDLNKKFSIPSEVLNSDHDGYHESFSSSSNATDNIQIAFESGDASNSSLLVLDSSGDIAWMKNEGLNGVSSENKNSEALIANVDSQKVEGNSNLSHLFNDNSFEISKEDEKLNFGNIPMGKTYISNGSLLISELNRQPWNPIVEQNSFKPDHSTTKNQLGYQEPFAYQENNDLKIITESSKTKTGLNTIKVDESKRNFSSGFSVGEAVIENGFYVPRPEGFVENINDQTETLNLSHHPTLADSSKESIQSIIDSRKSIVSIVKGNSSYQAIFSKKNQTGYQDSFIYQENTPVNGLNSSKESSAIKSSTQSSTNGDLDSTVHENSSNQDHSTTKNQLSYQKPLVNQENNFLNSLHLSRESSFTENSKTNTALNKTKVDDLVGESKRKLTSKFSDGEAVIENGFYVPRPEGFVENSNDQTEALNSSQHPTLSESSTESIQSIDDIRQLLVADPAKDSITKQQLEALSSASSSNSNTSFLSPKSLSNGSNSSTYLTFSYLNENSPEAQNSYHDQGDFVISSLNDSQGSTISFQNFSVSEVTSSITNDSKYLSSSFNDASDDFTSPRNEIFHGKSSQNEKSEIDTGNVFSTSLEDNSNLSHFNSEKYSDIFKEGSDNKKHEPNNNQVGLFSDSKDHSFHYAGKINSADSLNSNTSSLLDTSSSNGLRPSTVLTIANLKENSLKSMTSEVQNSDDSFSSSFNEAVGKDQLSVSGNTSSVTMDSLLIQKPKNVSTSYDVNSSNGFPLTRNESLNGVPSKDKSFEILTANVGSGNFKGINNSSHGISNEGYVTEKQEPDTILVAKTSISNDYLSFSEPKESSYNLEAKNEHKESVFAEDSLYSSRNYTDNESLTNWTEKDNSNDVSLHHDISTEVLTTDNTGSIMDETISSHLNQEKDSTNNFTSEIDAASNLNSSETWTIPSDDSKVLPISASKTTVFDEIVGLRGFHKTSTEFLSSPETTGTENVNENFSTSSVKGFQPVSKSSETLTSTNKYSPEVVFNGGRTEHVEEKTEGLSIFHKDSDSQSVIVSSQADNSEATDNFSNFPIHSEIFETEKSTTQDSIRTNSNANQFYEVDSLAHLKEDPLLTSIINSSSFSGLNEEKVNSTETIKHISPSEEGSEKINLDLSDNLKFTEKIHEKLSPVTERNKVEDFTAESKRNLTAGFSVVEGVVESEFYVPIHEDFVQNINEQSKPLSHQIVLTESSTESIQSIADSKEPIVSTVRENSFLQSVSSTKKQAGYQDSFIYQENIPANGLDLSKESSATEISTQSTTNFELSSQPLYSIEEENSSNQDHSTTKNQLSYQEPFFNQENIFLNNLNLSESSKTNTDFNKTKVDDLVDESKRNFKNGFSIDEAVIENGFYVPNTEGFVENINDQRNALNFPHQSVLEDSSTESIESINDNIQNIVSIAERNSFYDAISSNENRTGYQESFTYQENNSVKGLTLSIESTSTESSTQLTTNTELNRQPLDSIVEQNSSKHEHATSKNHSSFQEALVNQENNSVKSIYLSEESSSTETNTGLNKHLQHLERIKVDDLVNDSKRNFTNGFSVVEGVVEKNKGEDLTADSNKNFNGGFSIIEGVVENEFYVPIHEDFVENISEQTKPLSHQIILTESSTESFQSITDNRKPIVSIIKENSSYHAISSTKNPAGFQDSFIYHENIFANGLDLSKESSATESSTPSTTTIELNSQPLDSIVEENSSNQDRSTTKNQFGYPKPSVYQENKSVKNLHSSEESSSTEISTTNIGLKTSLPDSTVVEHSSNQGDSSNSSHNAVENFKDKPTEPYLVGISSVTIKSSGSYSSTTETSIKSSIKPTDKAFTLTGEENSSNQEDSSLKTKTAKQEPGNFVEDFIVQENNFVNGLKLSDKSIPTESSSTNTELNKQSSLNNPLDSIQKDSQTVGQRTSVVDFKSNSTKPSFVGSNNIELESGRNTEIEEIHLPTPNYSNNFYTTKSGSPIESDTNIQSIDMPFISNNEEASLKQDDSVRSTQADSQYYLTTSTPFQITTMNNLGTSSYSSTSDITSENELRVSEKLGNEFLLVAADPQQTLPEVATDNETLMNSDQTPKKEVSSADFADFEESEQLGTDNEPLGDQYSASNTSDTSYNTLSVEDFFQQFEEQEIVRPDNDTENKLPDEFLTTKLEVSLTKNNSVENVGNTKNKMSVEKIVDDSELSNFDSSEKSVVNNGSLSEEDSPLDFSTESGRFGDIKGARKNLETAIDIDSSSGGVFIKDFNETNEFHDTRFRFENVEDHRNASSIDSGKSDSKFPSNLNTNEYKTKEAVAEIFNSQQSSTEDLSENLHGSISQPETLESNDTISNDYETIANDKNKPKEEVVFNLSKNSSSKDGELFKYPDLKEEAEGFNTRSQIGALNRSQFDIPISSKTNEITNNGSLNITEVHHQKQNILTSEDQIQEVSPERTSELAVGNSQNSESYDQSSLAPPLNSEVLDISQKQYPPIVQDEVFEKNKSTKTFVKDSIQYYSPNSAPKVIDQNFEKGLNILEAAVPNKDVIVKSKETDSRLQANDSTSSKDVWTSSVSTEVVEKVSPPENLLNKSLPKIKISTAADGSHIVEVSQGSKSKVESTFDLSQKDTFLNTSKKEYPGIVEVEEIFKNNEPENTPVESSGQYYSANILERTKPKDDSVLKSGLNFEENDSKLNDSPTKNKTFSKEVWLSSVSSELVETGGSSESYLINSLSNSLSHSKKNDSVQINGTADVALENSFESVIRIATENDETYLFSSKNESSTIFNPKPSISVEPDNENPTFNPPTVERPLFLFKTNVSSNDEKENTIPAYIKSQFDAVLKIGQGAKPQDYYSNDTSETPKDVSSSQPLIKTLNISFGSGNTDTDLETNQHVVPRKGVVLKSVEEIRNSFSDSVGLISSSTMSAPDSQTSSNNDEEPLPPGILSAKSEILPNISPEHLLESFSSFNQIKDDGAETSVPSGSSETANLKFSPLNTHPLQKVYVPTISTEMDIDMTSYRISSTETALGLSSTPELNLQINSEIPISENSLSKSHENERYSLKNFQVQPEVLSEELPRPLMIASIPTSTEKNKFSSSFEVPYEHETHYSTQIPILQSADQILEQNIEVSSVRPAMSKADKDIVSKIILEMLNKSEQVTESSSEAATNSIVPNNLTEDINFANNLDKLSKTEALLARLEKMKNDMEKSTEVSNKMVYDNLKTNPQMSGSFNSEKQVVDTQQFKSSANWDEQFFKSLTSETKPEILTTFPSIRVTYPPVTPSYQQFTKPPAVFYPVNSPKSLTPTTKSKAAIVTPTNLITVVESATEYDQVSMIFPKDSMPTFNMALPGNLHQTYTKERLHKPLLGVIPTKKKNVLQETLPKPKSNQVKSPKEQEFNIPLKPIYPPSYFEESSTSRTTTTVTSTTENFVETTTPSLSSGKAQEQEFNIPLKPIYPPSYFEESSTSRTTTTVTSTTENFVETTTPSLSSGKAQEQEFNIPLKPIYPPSYFEESSTSRTTTTFTSTQKTTEDFVETTTPSLSSGKAQEVPSFVPGGVPIELMSNSDSFMSSKKAVHQSTSDNKFVPGGIPRDLYESIRFLPNTNNVKVGPVFRSGTPLGAVFGHFPSNNVLPFQMPTTTTASVPQETTNDNAFQKTYQFNLKMLKSTIEKVENDVKVLKETFIKSLNKTQNTIDPVEEKIHDGLSISPRTTNISQEAHNRLGSLSNSVKDIKNSQDETHYLKPESVIRDNITPLEQLDLLQETLDPALATRSISNTPQNLVDNTKFNLQTMMKNSEFKPINSNPIYQMSAKALANAQTINSFMSEPKMYDSVSKSNSKPLNDAQNQYEMIPLSETPQQLSEMNVESWTKLTLSDDTYSPIIQNIEAHNQKHTETQYTIQQENMYQESSTISFLDNSFVNDNLKNSINTITVPNQVDRKTTPTIYVVTPAPRTTTTTTELPTTTSTTTQSSTTTSTTPSTTSSTTTPSTTTSTTTPPTTTTTTTTTSTTTPSPVYLETTTTPTTIPSPIYLETTTTSKPTIVFKAPFTTSSTVINYQGSSQTSPESISANNELEKNIKLLEQLLQLQASLKPKTSSSSTTTTTSSTTPSTTTRATEASIKVISTSNADNDQFINQLRQLLLSQQQATNVPTTPSTSSTTTTTTTTTTTPMPTTTTTTRKPITISPQNLQDLLNSFSTPSFTTTSARPNNNADDIQFLNSLREIGKIQVTTSAPTTFANRIIELALKNRPARPTVPVYISTTVPPFVRLPASVKFPQILPSNEIEKHQEDQASLSADLSLLSTLLGRRITVADLPQITQQFGGNRVNQAPATKRTTTTTTTPRTTRRTTTTEKPMTKDEIAEIQKNLQLLSSLLGRPVSLSELPLIMQELRSGRKPKGTASSGATINFITPSPFKTSTTVRATARPAVSLPSQNPISQEEVIELLKDPSLGSPEQLNIYGQSNDAILAAVLKQRGIGPAHNNLPVNNLFGQEPSQRPYRPPRPTQPPPPPPPQRRPVLDGLAWLWRTWQDTGAPGNRVSKSNRQPSVSASTSTRIESPLLVGAFADAEPPTPSTNSNDGGEYADLQYPQNQNFGQGNGLLTAAFGVTRAVSQFLGAAFQGAAKSVQSAFSPQAIQQPSLISLSG